MQEHWNPPFEVLGRIEHGVYRVIPRGELDISTAPALTQALEQAERTHVDVIMLDLREITFIDSIGVQCLMNAYERSRSNGERLLIINGKDRIQRLLRIADLADALPLI